MLYRFEDRTEIRLHIIDCHCDEVGEGIPVHELRNILHRQAFGPSTPSQDILDELEKYIGPYLACRKWDEKGLGLPVLKEGEDADANPVRKKRNEKMKYTVRDDIRHLLDSDHRTEAFIA